MSDGYDGANILIAGEVERNPSLVSSSATNDEIVVEGDVRDDLESSPEETSEDTSTDTFSVENTGTALDGDYTVSGVTYDSGADESTITVTEDITTDHTGSGDDQISYFIFTDMAFQQQNTVNENANIITANHKKKGFNNKIYGKDDGDMNVDSLEIPPGTEDEVLEALERAKENKDRILVRRRDTNPDNDSLVIEEAPFLVSKITHNAPDDAAANYKVTLEQDDYWTEIASQ